MNHRFASVAVILGMFPLVLVADDSARAASSRQERIAPLEKRISEAVENGIHEWEAGLHSPVKWESVRIERASAVAGSIDVAADGTIRTSVDGKNDAVFVIHARPPQPGVTAFRFEWTATGRDAVVEIGELEIRPKADSPVALVSTATANSESPGGAITTAVDGNPATRWVSSPNGSKAPVAVFEFIAPLKSESPASVVLTLRNSKLARSPGSFRILATTANPPVLEVPESIRATLALEPSERSEEQRTEFEKFFRRYSRDCAALERELSRLRAEGRPAIKASQE